ncbi:MAG: tetratricopeptide repeat protein [Thiofilum sp.]|uniref:nSTAND1 domain-containing NTPase n=1 Tax=Thiofilum sp. TaxID=2212733 RepID=UPI0025E2E34D|nr:tetratricopeptide repeat protein [Thiofilum sp.]MBK8452391.1 trypsin-like peptidase domain-containing protein [Thiofilum sp.]
MSTRSVHSEIINPAIACIYDQALTSIVGTGFTLTERHVVTCAHVVNAALGRDKKNTVPPTEQELLTLSFLNSPHAELHRDLVAKVVKWIPQERRFFDLDDIAILELIDTPKPLAIPKLVQLTEHDYFSQRPFQAFGFNISEGSWADGRIGGLTASDTIQLNMERPIEEGFSGAPVWDNERCGVTGMLVTIRADLKTAYMLPLARLLQAFPKANELNLLRNPYRGLAVFEEQHAHNFFGREAVTQELIHQVSTSRFVFLMGISGSGKSSLLNAGLMYQLHQQGNHLVVQIRPSNEPFRSLAKQIIHLHYSDVEPLKRAELVNTLPDQLQNHQVSLESLLEDALHASGKQHLLLIIDQFEELYTQTKNEKLQADYINLLLELIANPASSITVLLSLRADFMARALAYAPLAQVLKQYAAQQVILTGMSKDELKRAIIEPADPLGVDLEQGLVERILLELDDDNAGQLPLLEFALSELWKRQQGRLLTHQALDEIGGVAHALAQHAEQVFNSYSAEEREAIKRIMVKLIVPGAGAEDTRQVARFSDFSVADQVLLPKLADHRLIVTGQELGDELPTVEVIHEALIREWGRLREWMEEYRDFRVWEERLKQRLADWVKHNKVNDDLLKGYHLPEAQEYLKSHALMLGAEAQSFIHLSAKVEQRQRRTRQGVVAGVIGVISIVAAVAIWQRQEAIDAQARTRNAFYEARELTLMVATSLPSQEKPINYGQLDSSFERLIESDFADIDTLEDISQILQDDKPKKTKLYYRLEHLYRKALETDPTNANILGKFANFIADVRHNHNDAEKLYQQAIEVDPKNATNLGNFAFFLKNVLNAPDKAKKLYQQAIEVNPEYADTLGRLATIRSKYNPEKAEKLYQQSIEADPTNATNLGNYAFFMVESLHRYDEAEKLYQQAIESDPTHATNLGNFANFMAGIRHNHDEAEKLYRQAIQVEIDTEEHPNALKDFLIFITGVLKDIAGHRKIEKSLKQGTHSERAKILGNFANFMTDIRHDYDEAEKLYQQAIEADPRNATNLRNFAKFMTKIRRNYDKAAKLQQQAVESAYVYVSDL